MRRPAPRVRRRKRRGGWRPGGGARERADRRRGAAPGHELKVAGDAEQGDEHRHGVDPDRPLTPDRGPGASRERDPEAEGHRHVHGQPPRAERGESAGEEQPPGSHQHRHAEPHREPPEQLLEARLVLQCRLRFADALEPVLAPTNPLGQIISPRACPVAGILLRIGRIRLGGQTHHLRLQPALLSQHALVFHRLVLVRTRTHLRPVNRHMAKRHQSRFPARLQRLGENTPS